VRVTETTQVPDTEQPRLPGCKLATCGSIEPNLRLPDPNKCWPYSMEGNVAKR